MTESDWIILRLIKQFETSSNGLYGDSLKAAMYLIKKYGKKTIKKNNKLLDKELNNEIEIILKKIRSDYA